MRSVKQILISLNKINKIKKVNLLLKNITVDLRLKVKEKDLIKPLKAVTDHLAVF